MSARRELNTFDIKEKKLQLVFVVLLIIILPILLYLLQQALSFRSKAAPEARLSLVPRNTAQTPDGKWRLPLGSVVTVDVVLDSGEFQAESMEAIIFYDPNVITLLDENTQNVTADGITCSQFTPLKYKVAAVVGGLNVQNGVETGAETGHASIACSAVPDGDPEAPYSPTPANFNAVVASFQFLTKQEATQKAITIDFTPADPRNDSAVLSYQGSCCSTVDVLGSVGDLIFDIVPTQENAILALSPSTGRITAGEQFDVQINLSTGLYNVDAVDAILEYDKTALRAVDVREGLLFSRYSKTPSPSGIDTSGVLGVIDITGQIDTTNTVGIQGDNLLFATITFEALVDGVTTNVNFKMDSVGARNDSNISQIAGGGDVLNAVINGTYSIVQEGISPTPTPYTATMRLSPATDTQVVGRAFDMNILLTTGQNTVDSTDVILQYDKNALHAEAVTPSSLFDNYSFIPGGTGIDETGSLGRITFSGHIDANSAGVTGTDLHVATIRFMPIGTTETTAVIFQFDGPGSRNDTNVVKFASGEDILQSVSNAQFRIGGAQSSIIQRIFLKIALQGRPDTATSKRKSLTMRIMGTHFENNPLTGDTNDLGEIEYTSALENRLLVGTYDIRIKPRGYLQRKFNVPLDMPDNTLDFTGSPFRAGDLDGSGMVNSLDWAIYLFDYGTNDDLSDIDGSGQVNALDNTYMLLNWYGQDEN